MKRTLSVLAAMGVWSSVTGFTPGLEIDADIKHWVVDALQHDPRIGSANVEVEVHAGIVALTGQVTSLAAWTYADLEAKKIKHVRGVINALEVTSPPGTSDAQVARQVKRRFITSAALPPRGIEVSCRNRAVELTGEVSSETERREAGLLASEVSGVARVDNRISVASSPMARNDDQIRRDVKASLGQDVYLNGFRIAVTVTRGVVSLEGTVGNLFEKRRAEERAERNRGVLDTHNALRVEPELAYGARDRPSQPSDGRLERALQAEFRRDRRLEGATISAHATSGHVTLEGSVGSHAQRQTAELDARDVVGVAWVSNALVVHAQVRDDRAIRDDVNFSLQTTAGLDGAAISAVVKHGVVTLTGTTHTWYGRMRAREIAARVKGVRQIINEIKVAFLAQVVDSLLADEIRDRLAWRWSTQTVYDRIDIESHQGVVTLTGMVETFAQRRDAESTALGTTGVWRVDNRLRVVGFDYPWDDWRLHSGNRN